MSILKNKRKLSSHQFKANYFGISNDVEHILRKIPRRRQKFIPCELNSTLINFYNILVIMDEFQSRLSAEEKIENCNKAINLLYDLSDYISLALILAQDQVSSNFVNGLETKLNNEALLLNQKIEKGVSMNDNEIFLYDNKKVKGVIYLEKLQTLYRMTMSKIIHLPHDYFILIKESLSQTAGRAFYYAYKANLIFTDTQSNIETRREYLQQSLSYLEHYEIELFDLFVNIKPSNEVIKAFSSLVTECNKLLRAIIKSDAAKKKTLK